VSFLRRSKDRNSIVVVVCNFTPVPRHDYRVGTPVGDCWREALNSDASLYGGSGQSNHGGLEAVPLPKHGRPDSINITAPPLGVVMFTNGGVD
jgi:1,4-alpha-glucan branching enzyme